MSWNQIIASQINQWQNRTFGLSFCAWVWSISMTSPCTCPLPLGTRTNIWNYKHSKREAHQKIWWIAHTKYLRSVVSLNLLIARGRIKQYRESHPNQTNKLKGHIHKRSQQLKLMEHIYDNYNWNIKGLWQVMNRVCVCVSWTCGFHLCSTYSRNL